MAQAESDRLDRFTKRALRALKVAQREAMRLGRQMIEPEHLLLAITHSGDGIATQALHNLGVEGDEVRRRIEQLTPRVEELFQDKVTLAPATKQVIELAVQEAIDQRAVYIGTEHLLMGILRQGKSLAHQVLTELNVEADALRNAIQQLPKEHLLPATFTLAQLPRQISPVFALLLLLTIGAGYLTYTELPWSEYALFVFVTGGWIVSLCLHEFAHALVAYLGGDENVVEEGYLSLNPLKYTHGVLSIGLPLLYLAMGGIGLPGGAVYIHRSAIRSKAMQALTSAAGPIATALCALLVLVPFLVTDPFTRVDHETYWAAMGLLAWLELSALVLNLLPIPGLDGFGILSPYLPQGLVSGVRGLGSLTFVLIFFLFTNDTFQNVFYTILFGVTSFFRLDGYWVALGLQLFRFWAN